MTPLSSGSSAQWCAVSNDLQKLVGLNPNAARIVVQGVGKLVRDLLFEELTHHHGDTLAAPD